MDTAKRLSPATLVLALLWLGFALVAGFVYYDAFAPLQRQLVASLGGFGLPLVAASLWLATRQSPRGRTPDAGRASGVSAPASRWSTPGSLRGGKPGRNDRSNPDLLT